MADSFSILHVQSFLQKMGIQVSQLLPEQDIIEMAFHGGQGQWRVIVALQQQGEVQKLLLIAPHFGTITTTKRLDCLEALMAINYRIAMGKFGLDLEDGEVRLEEAIPLAGGEVTYEQFQLAFGAIMQTAAMYHSLIPRIVYGNISASAALKACEQEFLKEYGSYNTNAGLSRARTQDPPDPQSDNDLNLNEVLAEVTRLLEEEKE